MMQKTLQFTMAIILTSIGTGHSQDFSAGKYHINESGLAIGGYDLVSYFEEEAPLQGDKDYSVDHDGATYYFVSAANQALFKSNPIKYLPQYGGFCAYGVGMKATADYQPGRYKSDPLTYKIIDEKLYLFYPTAEWPAIKNWNKNEAFYLKRANQLWPEIKNQ